MNLPEVSLYTCSICSGHSFTSSEEVGQKAVTKQGKEACICGSRYIQRERERERMGSGEKNLGL